MQKSFIVDLRLGSKYASVIGTILLPRWIYLPSNNEAIALAVTVYFDVSCDKMQQQLKILRNAQENTCVGVSTYQFNSQSMGWPDKRSSCHWRCAVRKGVLKNLQISQKITCFGAWNYKESLFNKVAANQACNFTKIRLQHRCFPVKFVKFLRTSILKNICQQMLL